MSAFAVETFNYENEEYYSGVSEILATLNENTLTSQLSLNLPPAESKQWNIENYPHLWAETDRIGASALTLKPKQSDQTNLSNEAAQDNEAVVSYSENNISAHELILTTLAQLRKKLRFSFKKEARQAKKLIDDCIEKLKEKLEIEKLNFLYFTMQETTEALKDNLQTLNDNINGYCEEVTTHISGGDNNTHKAANELKKGLHALTAKKDEYTNQLDGTFNALVKDGDITLRTANDSLNLTKKTHNLTKAITQHVKPLAIKMLHKNIPDAIDQITAIKTIQTINQRANQLNIITKRLADPFYTKPIEKSRPEKIRRWLRIATGTIAAISGIAAVICIFAAPPLVPILMGISMVGMYAVADDIFELLRHFIHKRSPTKKQVITQIISLAAAGLYGLGSHISVIASHASSVSAWIGKQIRHALPFLNSVSNFINRKVHYATNLSNVKEVFDQIQLQPIAEANIIALLSKKLSSRPVNAAVESSNEVPKSTKGLEFFPKVRKNDETGSTKNIDANNEIIQKASQIINEWRDLHENDTENKQKFAYEKGEDIKDLLKVIKQKKHIETTKRQTFLSLEASLRVIQGEIPSSDIDADDRSRMIKRDYTYDTLSM